MKNSKRVSNNNQNCGFAGTVKLKESEKKDEYLDLARESKKPWSMKVTTVPIVIGALGTVTEGLLKGLEDLEIREQVETI